MKFSRGIMSWVVILGMLIVLALLLNGGKSGKPIETWQEFTELIDPQKDKIVDNRVTVENSRITARVKAGELPFPGSENPTLITFEIDAQSREWFIGQLNGVGVYLQFKTGTSLWIQLLGPLIPFLLLILIIWFFIARSMRSAGGGPAACSAVSASRGTGSPPRTRSM